MSYKFGSSSIIKLSGCEQQLQILAYTSIVDSPIDFGISSGHRTLEEQFELFKKGREFIEGKWIVVDEKKVVTYCDGFNKLSDHNFSPSKAFDYFAYVNGRASWEKKYMTIIGNHIMFIANELKRDKKIQGIIKWGRYYKNFPDFPHIYLR